MKQTAVEWLVDKLLGGNLLMPSLIEQAKEMEKQQITSAYNKSTYQFANDAEVIEPKSALEYYNETYKK